ncbi:hypothetical protein L861_22535 [Litchfieldella anticariensis FP35 = DSM 16096]|uniref:Uncharacterized protein n=1 Tax=Litchfieldella anticariensis (strain DSM 16096 / CECT 5854 / CIP 108499 / LMG 22089 / FP35) TaxID=1121939 RepID=S2KMD9_LITA3|nr:hypothetical protein L861_22535 [Halomonas anticariensis FP35 = DSM 16096]
MGKRPVSGVLALGTAIPVTSVTSGGRHDALVSIILVRNGGVMFTASTLEGLSSSGLRTGTPSVAHASSTGYGLGTRPNGDRMVESGIMAYIGTASMVIGARLCSDLTVVTTVETSSAS